MSNKTINKWIGAHVSTTGGVFNAPKNASEIGAKAFALFLKNQQRWEAKPYTHEDISKFKDEITKYGFDPKYILPHDGYLINLGNADSEKREKSLKAFIDEMERARSLGLECINTHPGSHLKEISEEECIELIADSFNKAMDAVPDIKIIIENTAGQGSNMGYKFEHIGEIIKRINNKSRIGVCLDTCHTFAAGYELKTLEGYNETMDLFEKYIGFKYLSAVHLNDSMFDVGSKKDRHERIGHGFLGMEFFSLFMNDKRFDNIPIILETIDDSLWAQEIKLLYSLIKN